MDAKLQELIGHGIFRGLQWAANEIELAPIRKRTRELQAEVTGLRSRRIEVEKRDAILESRQRFEHVATLSASLILRSRGELCDRLRPYCWQDPAVESIVGAFRVEHELLVYLLATGERDAVSVDGARLRRLLLLHGMPGWIVAHNHRGSLKASGQDLDLAVKLTRDFGLVDFLVIGRREAWSMSRDRTYQRSK